MVYPAHGVGRVMGLEGQEIGGERMEMLVVSFEHERMVLRLPLTKASESGLRSLSSPDEMEHVVKTLKGRRQVKRTLWSRRAQEYESKINSGDPISIAEVIRDLFRKVDQSEQSYSERQLYQEAMSRLAREFAAISSISEEDAVKRIEDHMRSAAA